MRPFILSCRIYHSASTLTNQHLQQPQRLKSFPSIAKTKSALALTILLGLAVASPRIIHLAWLSSLTHLSCLPILRCHVYKHRIERTWRLLAMSILAASLAAGRIFIGHDYWALPGNRATPAICLIRNPQEFHKSDIFRFIRGRSPIFPKYLFLSHFRLVSSCCITVSPGWVIEPQTGLTAWCKHCYGSS